MNRTDSDPLLLRDYLRIFTRRRNVIVAVTIVCGLLAAAVSLLRSDPGSPVALPVVTETPSEVTAEARVLLRAAPGSTLNLETETSVVTSSQAVDQIAARMGIPAADVADSLQVAAVPNTEILAIRFTDSEAPVARRGASLAAAIYIEQLKADAAEASAEQRAEAARTQLRLRSRIGDLAKKIDLLDEAILRAMSAGDRLRARILVNERSLLVAHRLQLEDEAFDLRPDVVDSPQAILLQRARPVEAEGTEPVEAEGIEPVEAEGTEPIEQPAPAAPASSLGDLLRDTLAGLVLGALLGCGVALLQEHLDDRLGDLEGVTSVRGIEVLGVISNGDTRSRDLAVVAAKLEHFTDRGITALLVASPRSSGATSGLIEGVNGHADRATVAGPPSERRPDGAGRKQAPDLIPVPPILEDATGVLQASTVPDVLFVIDPSTTSQDLESAAQDLRSVGARVHGLVGIDY